MHSYEDKKKDTNKSIARLSSVSCRVRQVGACWVCKVLFFLLPWRNGWRLWWVSQYNCTCHGSKGELVAWILNGKTLVLCCPLLPQNINRQSSYKTKSSRLFRQLSSSSFLGKQSVVFCSNTICICYHCLCFEWWFWREDLLASCPPSHDHNAGNLLGVLC